MPEIELREVSFGYGERTVLAPLSLTMPSGAVTTLLGPNGSGKSTLLRGIADLHRPDQGDVLLDQRPVRAFPSREFARTVSFLPQAPLVPESITARELVQFGRYPHRGPFGRRTSDDGEAVDWALRVTGTGPFADRQVDTLSGGERQRVWIAMALAQRTGLVLLDEPTTYLDIRYQVEVLDLVRDLVDDHGLTVVLVLHDINQAAAYADWMVVLHEGAVAAQGKPSEVITSPTVSLAFGLDVDVEPDPLTGAPTCHFYRRRTQDVTARSTTPVPRKVG